MTCPLQIGCIGTALEATVPDCANSPASVVDISGFISLIIKLRNPKGVVVEKTADLTTDGTDGKMHYVTVEGDLNMKGIWSIQGIVELPAGKWNTAIDRFEVVANL